MPITGSLLKINGTAIEKLRTFKVGQNKLWSSAERNMNGSLRASMIGIFPKIEIETSDATPRSQVQTLAQLLDQPYFSVEYYDAITNSRKTARYYASDYAIELQERQRELFMSIKVSLVPVDRRA